MAGIQNNLGADPLSDETIPGWLQTTVIFPKDPKNGRKINLVLKDIHLNVDGPEQKI